MGQAAKYRKARLGCASVQAERDDRGRIFLRSTEKLAPYPARLTPDGTARIKGVRTGRQQHRRRRHDPVAGSAATGVVLQDIPRVSIRI